MQKRNSNDDANNDGTGKNLQDQIWRRFLLAMPQSDHIYPWGLLSSVVHQNR